MNKPKPLTLWSRFIHIVRPDFVQRLNTDNSTNKSWGFWFLSNFLVIAILTIGIGIFTKPYVDNFPNNIVDTIPAETVIQADNQANISVQDLIRNFEIELHDNQLTLTNIPDPAVIVFDEDTETATLKDSARDISKYAPVIIIDTKGDKFDPNVATNFDQGAFLFGDQIIIREGKKAETTTIYFADIGENFVLNYDIIKNHSGDLKYTIFYWVLGLLALFGYLFLAGVRLLSALLWGLLFWGIGSLIQIKDWTFEKSLMAVLHFMLLTLIVFITIFLTGADIPGHALILLVLLFGMNFWHIKHSK